MDTVVISIGGSVLVSDRNDADYLKAIASLLRKLSTTHKLYVVTGGGRIARYYILTGRALGADESTLDELGIAVTRLNARLLITAPLIAAKMNALAPGPTRCRINSGYAASVPLVPVILSL